MGSAGESGAGPPMPGRVSGSAGRRTRRASARHSRRGTTAATPTRTAERGRGESRRTSGCPGSVAPGYDAAVSTPEPGSIPSAIAALPRFRLFDGPSPFHRLPRFSDALGGGIDVWIKREDLLPIAFGGNKLRNLEFLVGAALAEGADTLVTSGRRWSNHCRLTAAAGRACRARRPSRPQRPAPPATRGQPAPRRAARGHGPRHRHRRAGGARGDWSSGWRRTSGAPGSGRS